MKYFGNYNFWSHEYWLPKNPLNGKTYEWSEIPTKYTDLVFSLALGLIMLVFRYLFEAFVAFVFHNLNYSDFQNPNVFNKNRKKILENAWRVFAYSILFIYGFVVLNDKAWSYNIKLCWIGYPKHLLETSLWYLRISFLICVFRFYYLIETGFYCSLLFSCAFDHRRIDFWPMFFHHVITICLFWITNFIRIGSLIIFLHDISDVTLEFAKFLRYSKCKEFYVKIGFVTFLLSWVFSRLFCFPLLIHSAIFDAPNLIQPGYNLFWKFYETPYSPRLMIYLLLLLMLLHLFWTVLIIQTVYQTLKTGQASDVRSDDEDDEKKQFFKGSKKSSHLKTRKKQMKKN